MASLSGNSTRTVVELYRQTIRACAQQGEVYVGLVDGRIQGVVAWIASGQDWQCYNSEEFMRSLSSYLSEWYTYHYIPTYEDLYRCSFSAGGRARLEAVHIKMLAVHPDCQKRGYGRQLLGLACGQADANNKRAVADVKGPQLVSWLGKSGFVHRGVKNFTSRDTAGFPLWCMSRDPKR